MAPLDMRSGCFQDIDAANDISVARKTLHNADVLPISINLLPGLFVPFFEINFKFAFAGVGLITT